MKLYIYVTGKYYNFIYTYIIKLCIYNITVSMLTKIHPLLDLFGYCTFFLFIDPYMSASLTLFYYLSRDRSFPNFSVYLFLQHPDACVYTFSFSLANLCTPHLTCSPSLLCYIFVSTQPTVTSITCSCCVLCTYSSLPCMVQYCRGAVAFLAWSSWILVGHKKNYTTLILHDCNTAQYR